MPYAQRDENGIIVALFSRRNDQATEQVGQNHPDVATFLADENGDPQVKMVRSDMEMARVVEDLINVLIDRGIIQMDLLPPATQRKIKARQHMRVTINQAIAEQLFPGA